MESIRDDLSVISGSLCKRKEHLVCRLQLGIIKYLVCIIDNIPSIAEVKRKKYVDFCAALNEYISNGLVCFESSLICFKKMAAYDKDVNYEEDDTYKLLVNITDNNKLCKVQSHPECIVGLQAACLSLDEIPVGMAMGINCAGLLERSLEKYNRVDVFCHQKSAHVDECGKSLDRIFLYHSTIF